MTEHTKNLYLHIGRHKTGTSTIQNFVSNNSELLKSQNLAYPKSCRHDVAHHELAGFFSTRRDRKKEIPENYREEPVVSDLLNEIEGLDEDVLISSESLQNSAPKYFSDLFSNRSVEILIYLRNQIDYLASSYAQIVWATHYTGSMEQYFEEIFNIDYQRFLDTWENSFPGRLKVRLFARDKLAEGDILIDFFSHMLPAVDEQTLQIIRDRKTFDSNPSLTARLLAYKLRYNSSGVHENVNDKENRVFLRTLGNLSQTIGDEPVRVTEELSQKCRKRSMERNSYISERYFGGQTIFDEDRPTAETVRINEDEVQHISSELVALEPSLDQLAQRVSEYKN